MTTVVGVDDAPAVCARTRADPHAIPDSVVAAQGMCGAAALRNEAEHLPDDLALQVNPFALNGVHLARQRDARNARSAGEIKNAPALQYASFPQARFLLLKAIIHLNIRCARMIHFFVERVFKHKNTISAAAPVLPRRFCA